MRDKNRGRRAKLAEEAGGGASDETHPDQTPDSMWREGDSGTGSPRGGLYICLATGLGASSGRREVPAVGRPLQEDW